MKIEYIITQKYPMDRRQTKSVHSNARSVNIRISTRKTMQFGPIAPSRVCKINKRKIEKINFCSHVLWIKYFVILAFLDVQRILKWSHFGLSLKYGQFCYQLIDIVKYWDNFRLAKKQET